MCSGVAEFRDYFKSIYPILCCGHQFMFRRANYAETNEQFVREVSFAFEPQRQTDEGKEPEPSQSEIRAALQKTMRSLEDPEIMDYLGPHFPIVQDLDASKSILFALMKRELVEKGVPEELFPLFEGEFHKALENLNV
jgi:hypothetical protein